MYYTRPRVFGFLLLAILVFYRLPAAIVFDLTATVAAAERNPNADGKQVALHRFCRRTWHQTVKYGTLTTTTLTQ
jgi:hypothetical protein